MPRLAVAQLASSESLAANAAKALSATKTAAANGADVIVFPEIHLSPFFPQYPDCDAEPYLLDLDHEVILNFQDTCRSLNIIAAPNVYLREGKARYDASILIGRDGSILGVSKMVHIVQAPKFFEQNYYTPSKGGFRVYDTEAGRIGIVICFDRHYPESFRSCAMQSADIVLVPTVNMADEPIEMFEWEMRVSAYHNSLYIAMCNRVGREGDADYCGRSLVVDPRGGVIHRSGASEAIDYVDFDPAVARAERRRNHYLKLYDVNVFAERT